MPIYEITAPDGTVLEIEGDTPPNEQQLNEIFAQVQIPQDKNSNSLNNLNEKYKQFAQDKLDKRIKWEENHPFISRMQADYQPGYRAERTGMEEAAEYGFKTPMDVALKNSATRLGQATVPFVNAARDAALTYLTKGKGGFLPNIAKAAGVGAIQNATAEGLDELSNNGIGNVLDRTTQGAKTGGTIGGALATVLGSMPYIGRVMSQGTVKAIENPNVQDAITSGLEVLTSVPKRSSQIALENELAGTSILNKPFDARTAYQPIEKMVKKAKGMLPTPADFGNDYYQLGQKALQGMENLQKKAGEDIASVLKPLNNKEVQNGGLNSAIDSLINSFGEGGIYNSAKVRAKNVLDFVNENLNKEGTSLRDLHRIKGDLYDIGYNEAGNKNGVGAEVARGIAEQINNYLRRVSPSYAKPNDIFSLVKDITRGLDGETTIGNKLSDIGSVNSAKSGLDQKLKAIDNLLPEQNKFYKKAQNIIENENTVNNIRNQIGKVYERNPRLLLNKTDEAFNQAFDDLQSKTGINIREPLEKIVAREHFAKLLPGQGGGSGSAQGAGNLAKAQIFGKAVESALQGNLKPLAMSVIMSPLIGGKGTIYNVGKAYTKALQNLKNVDKPNELMKLIPSLGAIGGKIGN